MSTPIDSVTGSSFNHFGHRTFLDSNGRINHPDEIYIGDDVNIEQDYWLNIIAKEVPNTPKIIISSGCQIKSGLIISAMNSIHLEPRVTLGQNVFISDTDHVYQNIGKPILAQGLTHMRGQVRIGEGVVIEDGAVIAGNVSIGAGSVIRANSLVEQDIPPHSIVQGIPAQLIAF